MQNRDLWLCHGAEPTALKHESLVNPGLRKEALWQSTESKDLAAACSGLPYVWSVVWPLQHNCRHDGWRIIQKPLLAQHSL